MENDILTPPTGPRRLFRLLQSGAAYLFYAAVLAVIFYFQWIYHIEHRPGVYKPLLMRYLWNGTAKEPYTLLGEDFAQYKPYLPQRGPLKFMSLVAMGPDRQATTYFEDARSYLAPLVLTNERGQAYGIVYYPTNELAEENLAKFGYRWLKRIREGKGIAVRADLL